MKPLTPILPQFLLELGNPTEEAIEAKIEFAFNRADKRFMRGDVTRADYDRFCREANAWAARQFARLAAMEEERAS